MGVGGKIRERSRGFFTGRKVVQCKKKKGEGAEKGRTHTRETRQFGLIEHLLLGIVQVIASVRNKGDAKGEEAEEGGPEQGEKAVKEPLQSEGSRGDVGGCSIQGCHRGILSWGS